MVYFKVAKLLNRKKSSQPPPWIEISVHEKFQNWRLGEKKRESLGPHKVRIIPLIEDLLDICCLLLHFYKLMIS